MPRSMGLDRSLLGAVGALFLFGLVVLYSAGQTDVPNFAARGAWERQLIWLGIGAVSSSLFRAGRVSHGEHGDRGESEACFLHRLPPPNLRCAARRSIPSHPHAGFAVSP